MPDPRGSAGATTTKMRRLRVFAMLALLAGGAALYWYQTPGSDATRPARAGSRPAVRVSIAVAARQDVPVYATGLGRCRPPSPSASIPRSKASCRRCCSPKGSTSRRATCSRRIDPRLSRPRSTRPRPRRRRTPRCSIAAEKDLARSKTLVVQNVATQQNVDQQQAKVDQLKASIAADEAAIETAQTQLDYTAIKAPSDGRIGVRLVDPGNLVHASDARAIATLVLTQPSAVMFTLPMQVLDDVREAMARGPVEVTAFDQNNRRQLSTGKLLLIDNAIDQSTATSASRRCSPTTDERLWPGEFVNARRAARNPQERRSRCRRTAVQRGPQGLFAWVVSDDNKAEPRPIELGPASGDLTVITAGIAEGDRVVTDGQYKLQVDAPVEIVGGPTAGSSARERRMNLSEPFIRRPVATSLIMAALALLGITAFPFLPVAPLPQVDFPTVQVTATLAGASAETMASSVAAPLERQFGQIPGVTQMTSLSALGVSQVVIQFDLNRNIDLAAQDVQAAITAASKFLPQAMTQPPNYRKVNPADAPIMMLWAHSDTLPLTTVHDYLDNFFIQALSQVPGVAQASIIGDQKPSIRIQVDPAKLAAIGLTLEEVRAKLVNATSNAAKGTIYTPKVGFTIAANDQITEAEPFNDVILAYRDGARAPGARRRPGGARADQPLCRRFPQQQARHPAEVKQAARRQRHRHRRAHQGAAAASSPPTFRRR